MGTRMPNVLRAALLILILSLEVNIETLNKKHLRRLMKQWNMMKPQWMTDNDVMTTLNHSFVLSYLRKYTHCHYPNLGWTELPDVAPNMVASVPPVKPCETHHWNSRHPFMRIDPQIGYRKGTMILVFASEFSGTRTHVSQKISRS